MERRRLRREGSGWFITRFTGVLHTPINAYREPMPPSPSKNKCGSGQHSHGTRLMQWTGKPDKRAWHPGPNSKPAKGVIRVAMPTRTKPRAAGLCRGVPGSLRLFNDRRRSLNDPTAPANDRRYEAPQFRRDHHRHLHMRCAGFCMASSTARPISSGPSRSGNTSAFDRSQ